MFSSFHSPTGHFSLNPLPASFFETPPPFGAGALLVLNKFANNSAVLRAEHLQAIQRAAGQGKGNVSAMEVYGITDRSGSEALNRNLSTRRANATLSALTKAFNLSSANIVFANGLGERFAAEYFKLADNDRNPAFRGVACYLWASFATASDIFLRVNTAFAAPPNGGSGQSRVFLPALHMGRLRTQPRSIFT